MAVRNSSDFASVLLTPDTQKVRISSTFASVLLSVINLSEPSPSDTLNGWNDAAQVDFLVYAGPQTINVGDQLILQDGYAITFNPASIQIAVNSLNANNFDSLAIGYGIAVSDDANNLTDSAEAIMAITEAYDSMFYGLADNISLQLYDVFNVNVSDTNTLSDTAAASLFSSKTLSDSFSLSDNTALTFNYLLAASDTLTLTDAINIQLNYLLTKSDDLNAWNDTISTALTTAHYDVQVDDLNNFDDEVELLLNTSLTNYLRRYLNDVVN